MSFRKKTYISHYSIRSNNC